MLIFIVDLGERFFKKLARGANPEDYLDERLIWELLKNMLQTAKQLVSVLHPK